MIYLYNYLTPKYFYLFLVLIYVFLLVIIFFKKSIYKKLPLETYKKNPEMLLDYLDKYYIKNKYITFGLVVFYILLKVGVVLYLRYLYLGNETYITRFLSEIQYLSFIYLLKVFCILLLFIISIQLFFVLLYNIFFDEMLKVYIYSMKNKKVLNIQNKLAAFYTKDISGPCYLFFECIYRKTPEPDNFFYNQYYIYDYIYDYKFIKKITLIMIILSKKYYFIFLFVKFCRKMCHIFYVHFDSENIFKYFPLVLLIITFVYDFFQGNIYYTYYLLFFCYFLNLYNNFYSFIYKFDFLLISELKAYFYENDPEYSKQRVDDCKNLKLSLKNSKNSSLLYTLNNAKVIEHIYYNFKKESDEDIKMRMMNFRFYIFMLLSILVAYLVYLIIYNKITCNYSSFILVSVINIFWLLTMFYGKNTYILEKEDPNNNEFPIYIYNKKYEVIFWLLIIMQLYIYWKLLFKPQIVFMDTEILLQLPFDMLKITKIYNSEDQILYLFQYFEHKLTLIAPENQEYLRHILRQIDFNSLITSEYPLNLKDIQVYVNLLLDNNSLLTMFIDQYITAYLEDLKQHPETIIEENYYIDFVLDLILVVILGQINKRLTLVDIVIKLKT